MTCDEIRRYWLDGDGDGIDGSVEWIAHRAGCPACADWERAQRTLDGTLRAALFVAPPPELTVRLAAIPAPSVRPAPARPYVLDVALLIVAALGVIGLGGGVATVIAGLVAPFVFDLLQVIPLVLDSPVIGYYQQVATTAIEALATLMLIALVLLQASPKLRFR